MQLSLKQQRFTVMIGLLISRAYELGYGLTFGDAYRSPSVTYGHKSSLHRKRLAVDFNIFKDGDYLSGDEAKISHGKLHDYWDELGGSRRISGDLNHYSLSDEGMR